MAFGVGTSQLIAPPPRRLGLELPLVSTWGAGQWCSPTVGRVVEKRGRGGTYGSGMQFWNSVASLGVMRVDGFFKNLLFRQPEARAPADGLLQNIWGPLLCVGRRVRVNASRRNSPHAYSSVPSVVVRVLNRRVRSKSLLYRTPEGTYPDHSVCTAHSDRDA